MKRGNTKVSKAIIATLVMILGVFIGVVCSNAGDKVNLTEPETLSIPVALQMDIRHIHIDFDSQYVDVVYQWLDSDGNPIQMVDGYLQSFKCEEECFQKTFDYKLKSSDNGYSIGLFFRDLVWDQLKVNKLKPGNSGTFEKTKSK